MKSSVAVNRLASVSMRSDLTAASVKKFGEALTNYLEQHQEIDAVWLESQDKRSLQVTFYVEYGHDSERIVGDLTKLGIGKESKTKLFVLSTTITVQSDDKYKNDILLASSASDLMKGKAASKIPNDAALSDVVANKSPWGERIRRRMKESNFMKSIRARLIVHQVVASVRASTALSFDFVMLLILASIIAALGLLESSSVIIVASMLVSPLMSPIVGIAFGLSIRDRSLWWQGVRNALIGILICVMSGFFLG
jgi:hypothetical protein